MKISLKWLSKYVNVTSFMREPSKLADLLTNAGLEVEGVVDQAKQFNHVVVGQILEKNKHPNADNLTLCLVNTGDAQRRIVCGAKNHNAGDKVVVALPGALLPGDFAIKISKIRGEESQGMLCSEKELGLSSADASAGGALASPGIMILPPNAPIGESFARYSKNDDVIFDIKVTPNRADCLSHFGLAREIAGLVGERYELPLTPFVEGRESTRKLIKVVVEDAERCPRYAGRVVQNVKIGPSPEWLRKYLEAVGLRSINNVVDITNFVMLELGQPLHAFDLSTLAGPQITVRRAKEGEKFVTLDEKELVFDGSELLICDGEKPVALAGVIGGLHSGVNDNTVSVFIESAYFLPGAVRRASRRHGVETDSSYRFSRGVDPDGIVLAMNRACQLLSELATGTVCSDSYDIYPRPVAKPRIDLDLAFISARLGVQVEGTEAKRLLERVGCDVSGSGNKLLINPPAYRGDLKLAEDLGEEILRLKGFGQIPETLPAMTAEPTTDALPYRLEYEAGLVLRGLGFHQATNLNLASSVYESQFLTERRGNTQELGVDFVGPAISVKNPLNLELNIMRLAIVPSLVRNTAFNLRHGSKTGALFEIAPVFKTKESKDIRDEVRPFTEVTHLGMVLWGLKEPAWIKSGEDHPFFKLKGRIEELLRAWQFKSFKFEAIKEVPGFLHPGQSARIFVEGKPVGFVGVLHPATADQLEIKVPVAIAEVNFTTLSQGQPRFARVKALPKFPAIERDVALLAPISVSAGEIKTELTKAGGQLVVECEAFDLYSGANLPADRKSLAFKLIYQDLNKTLSDEEVNALHQKAVEAVCRKLGLSVR